MHKLKFLLGALVLVLLAQGCDTSGVHSLNVKIDTTTNCGRSTWMRTTDTGTEVFLLGETNPTTPVTDEGVCFVRAFVEFDSSAVVEQGSYTLDANGTGTFNVDRVYTFPYQPNLGPFDRDGATVNDNPVPASYALTITEQAPEIVIGVDTTARRLTNIYDVLRLLDPDSQAGAENIYRMYNLSLFTSQVRVLAFGGAGMTMYLNSKKEFMALVEGSFSVVVEYPLAVTTISYMDYIDLHGIYVDGDQITKVNALGNGTMEGALAFEMRGSDDPTDVLFAGNIDYKAVTLTTGVAAGGVYTVNVDGHGSYDVPYTLAADTDLRSLLPASTP